MDIKKKKKIVEKNYNYYKQTCSDLFDHIWSTRKLATTAKIIGSSFKNWFFLR